MRRQVLAVVSSCPSYTTDLLLLIYLLALKKLLVVLGDVVSFSSS